MSEPREFLKSVYHARSPEEARALYDDWAPSYDAEITRNGYATPTRLARAMADLLPDKRVPVLDFGCGTGLSGLALARAGFATIDGCDLSEGMLAQAHGRGVYRRLWLAEADRPGFEDGAYFGVVAAGVVSLGAAPPATLDRLVAALLPGGVLGFSYNDHTMEVAAYVDKVTELTDSRQCRLLRQEHGPHLPGIGLGSTIFLLERR